MKAESMEPEHVRGSAMDERSAGDLRRDLVRAMQAGQPQALALLLSAFHDLGKLNPEFQKTTAALAARADEGRERASDAGRRARKVSVSMPEELNVAVHQRVGRGGFSRYVTEAVAKQLELDLLAELSEMLEEEHGTVSEGALAEAESVWPDAP